MKTILVVDDVPENIRLLKTILESANYNVKVANNGKRCLEVVEKTPIPDLILLDIMMPEMNGYDVIKRLKSNDHTKSIPVIFITTKDEVSDEKLGLDLGAVDYIPKPVDHVIALARIKTHLELYSYRMELEKQVKEKTDQILKQKEELFMIQKKAAMGDLVGVIAHQLMQPLSALGMNSFNLKMEFDSKKLTPEYVDNYVEEMGETVNFMGRSINELKNFFKPNKIKTRYNLKSTVEKTLALIKITDMDIRLNIDADIFLNGFENEFKQVIMNLVKNAKDAHKEKRTSSPWLEIRAFHEAERVGIDIQDNAGGIPEEIIQRVFDSYFSTKGEEGTGIGLNLSKMIIEESMGGKLSVHNTGDGAVFRIEIPMDVVI